MFTLAMLTTARRADAQTEKILHSFNGTGMGGQAPEAGLIFDSSGNLYSTTSYGSTYGDGDVFELSPGSGGTWNTKVLHIFGSSSKDGTGTFAGVIFDSAGNLYGVAGGGGLYGYGDVFELSPKSGGGWTEKIIHNFNQDGTDGTYPFGPLTFDTSGNLYGTTTLGGTDGQGIVFPAAGSTEEPCSRSCPNDDVLRSIRGALESHAHADLRREGNSYGGSRAEEISQSAFWYL